MEEEWQMTKRKNEPSIILRKSGVKLFKTHGRHDGVCVFELWNFSYSWSTEHLRPQFACFASRPTMTHGNNSSILLDLSDATNEYKWKGKHVCDISFVRLVSTRAYQNVKVYQFHFWVDSLLFHEILTWTQDRNMFWFNMVFNFFYISWNFNNLIFL